MSSKYLLERDLTRRLRSCKGLYALAIDEYQKATTCPVCQNLLKYDTDVQSFLEWEACSDCVDTYYYPNANRWNKGWRPNLKGEKNDV
jgi:hypothetical protein